MIERLGWTLLHSTWQGLAVALFVAVILPAIRRRAARAAYAVCCGALLLTVLLPAITFCVVLESPRAATRPGRIAQASVAVPASDALKVGQPAPVHSMQTLLIVPIEALPAHGVDHRGKVPTDVASRPSMSIDERTIAEPSPSASPAPAFPLLNSWGDRVAGLGRKLREQLALWLPWRFWPGAPACWPFPCGT